jgi:hypothetical protein
LNATCGNRYQLCSFGTALQLNVRNGSFATDAFRTGGDNVRYASNSDQNIALQ